MTLPENALLWALVIVPTLAVVIIAIIRSHKPYSLSRALLVNAFCSGCFAGPLMRLGWDKALVAFLALLGITSGISFGIWSARHPRTPSASSGTDGVTP